MTVVTFGSFPGGATSEFSDVSQNGFSPWLTLMPNGLVSGCYLGRFTTYPGVPIFGWDSDHYYRVHLIGSSAVVGNFLQRGRSFYRCLSVRWVQGPYCWAGDEIHGANSAIAGGPAPLNGASVDGSTWNWVVRGGGNAAVYGSQVQNNYGGSPSYSNTRAWQGLSSSVIFGEWLHSCAYYNPFDVSGNFALWVARHGQPMVNVVPLTSIPAAYGSPTTFYPMLSLYSAGDGNTRIMDMTAGAYASTLAEVQAYQVSQIGYDPWSSSGGGGSGGGGGNGGSDPNPYDVVPARWMGGTYAITGTTLHGSQADKQRCYRVVVIQDGIVDAIGHYREPQAGAGTEQIKLAIWADNGLGTDPAAAAPLAQTAEIDFTQATPTGRYSTALVAPLAVRVGQVLWVGDLDGGTPNIAYTRRNTVAGAFRIMGQPFASGVGAWDPIVDSAYDLDMTIWLEGTAGSAPGTPGRTVMSGHTVGGRVVGAGRRAGEGGGG